jgi:hypothetical protein
LPELEEIQELTKEQASNSNSYSKATHTNNDLNADDSFNKAINNVTLL